MIEKRENAWVKRFIRIFKYDFECLPGGYYDQVVLNTEWSKFRRYVNSELERKRRLKDE